MSKILSSLASTHAGLHAKVNECLANGVHPEEIVSAMASAIESVPVPKIPHGTAEPSLVDAFAKAVQAERPELHAKMILLVQGGMSTHQMNGMLIHSLGKIPLARRAAVSQEPKEETVNP